jgi:hypothetical protein
MITTEVHPKHKYLETNMSLLKIQHNNINDFFNREDIVRETVAQIKRDFEQFGLEITYSGTTDNVYQELLQQVTSQVAVLLLGSSDQIYALLYRIDISDKSIVNASLQLPHYTHVEVISHQIIFRDLQKVLTRRYFKQESINKRIE